MPILQSGLDSLHKSIFAPQNPMTINQSARTAVAALIALVVARLLGSPEAYWAPITTLIVMQSTLGASLRISIQRLVGTAMGAIIGALAIKWFGNNAAAFGVLVFVIGAICTSTRIERVACRYASITLAIIMLVGHEQGPWIVALHRFIEVSIGIAAALLLAAVWPEKLPPPPSPSPAT